ncbi:MULTISPECIES: nuclear transport factor 2 family protein [Chryseobacterium]|uniref:Ketosteroid isomerase-like protein n=1 Tax=Chryseobacterium camelliae TaxID=1265445 RepID=A0ABU0TE84_9FLAO|nr:MULTISPECIES: nuclear transport factor 2 family protein [Chryseobacterium]MDT3406830.1 ketosteroid isomerase-like protein [Pseudacidovorax intermedius]MDQ1095374.1 ketosteroid isomerase-like protein [Chryseobacterium camelliae]MDQ1099312.1 ketosteroid isomerase-like protein [Chryseobacterium sp. SORGH_AS_1048]MDR6086661.1 ketosteroid isomerase-like protein [Chryseobacterium sp. SORGH_AS_0909]MDR6131033.1 ketosteroid isomerase-like protein [Chryseobacterium sp. SORGH_AS_1175]
MEAKEIVKAYYQAVTDGRFEDILKYKSPDATYWISGDGSWPLGGWRTPEDMANIHKLLQDRFPKGLTISIRSVVVEGNSAVVHLNNFAVRVDGKIYDNEIVVLMKLEGGLITEEREFLDTIHVNDLFFGEMEK